MGSKELVLVHSKALEPVVGSMVLEQALVLGSKLVLEQVLGSKLVLEQVLGSKLVQVLGSKLVQVGSGQQTGSGAGQQTGAGAGQQGSGAWHLDLQHRLKSPASA